ncbi:hypothetical protein [Burkholderia ubonensis]|uniref:hypothetical protein n=1 Tax=Burkholderia ubonensis TaxID=101571 RepID=UPI000A7BCC5A|nr:hypothetical protein [Burkholderia ubonensis]
MYQIDNSTAATSQPAATAAGSAGFFTDGNPATGAPATILPAEWLNAVMMELANVVTGAGLTLSKSTYNQVLAAIKRIGQNTIVLADTGVANAYTATNATPLVAGTWVDGVVQAIKIAHANTGASTYAPDGLTPIPIYGLGLQPLQGGELALNGTAVLMHATIAGVNSGNPIAVLMECAGGAQQVAPATQSNHAITAAQAAGLVGGVRNLTMSVSAASASATLTADEIIVETALGGIRYCLPSFNQTINLATTGAGGMDTGTAPTNGFVALYAIYNPTTKAAALLAANATSTTAAAVYGGANMPAGYTASALVSVWPTNASRQLQIGYQSDRAISLTNAVLVSSSTGTSGTLTYYPLSISSFAPANARYVTGFGGPNYASGASNFQLDVAASSSGIGNLQVVGNGSTGNPVYSPFRVPIITPQTIYYDFFASTGTSAGGTIYLNGYEF